MSDLCSGVEKEIVKEISQFTHYTVLYLLGVGGGGARHLQFLGALTYMYICHIKNLVKICQVVIENMLTDDARRTSTHSNMYFTFQLFKKKY